MLKIFVCWTMDLFFEVMRFEETLRSAGVDGGFWNDTEEREGNEVVTAHEHFG